MTRPALPVPEPSISNQIVWATDFQALVEAHNDWARLYAEDRKDMQAVVRMIPMALLVGLILTLGVVIRDVQAHAWIKTVIDALLIVCWIAMVFSWFKTSQAFTTRPARLLAHRIAAPTPAPTPEENPAP